MSDLHKRRELYDHKRRGYAEGIDEEWWRKQGELKAEEKVELQKYFSQRYGPSLGDAAARFASLYFLPPDVEAQERLSLIDHVLSAMETGLSPTSTHPMHAVIEATELRTDKNYIRPENRSGLALPRRDQYEDLMDEPQ